jgi:hypothetical protein
MDLPGVRPSRLIFDKLRVAPQDEDRGMPVTFEISDRH